MTFVVDRGCWSRKKIKAPTRVQCAICSLWIEAGTKVETCDVHDHGLPEKEARFTEYRHPDYACPPEAFPRPWRAEEILAGPLTFGPRCERCEHMIRGFEHVFERSATPTTNEFLHTTDEQCRGNCQESRCKKKHPDRNTFYKMKEAA